MQAKRIITAFIVLLAAAVQAQVRFSTLVTELPVVLGESCRVQYVMEVVTPGDTFIEPDFRNFRVISGPEERTAIDDATSGFRQLRNISYVLAPTREGTLTVPGAKAVINGRSYSSPAAVIRVISREKAAALLKEQQRNAGGNTNVYLAPGEDATEKIRKGLFMKVSVDKSVCYVGQPVTATFRLYSRLYSKSDIVKNPGFYGFTVQEMQGLKDRAIQTEDIDGRKYDVHTIRQVQLYPLSAGSFEIDPMEVSSKVRFSRSAVDIKPEQQVEEGVYEHNDPVPGPGWVEYDYAMRSEPVKVTVKALPVNGKPQNWSGAVGKFQVSWRVRESILAANEEGHLEVTISGTGNFTQLVAPVIQWPAGLEGFEPRSEDELDVMSRPLKGYRRFIYPFVASHSGDFSVPALQFSFFNSDSNKYSTLKASTLSLSISGEKPASGTEPRLTRSRIDKEPYNPSVLYLVIIVSLVLIAAFFTWRRETCREKEMPLPPLIPEPPRLHADEALRPAAVMLGAGGRDFYAALHSGTWKYLADRLRISGTELNKQRLREMLAGRVQHNTIQELMDLIETCEMGLYTDAVDGYDKSGLLEAAHRIMDEIDSAIR